MVKNTFITRQQLQELEDSMKSSVMCVLPSIRNDTLSDCCLTPKEYFYMFMTRSGLQTINHRGKRQNKYWFMDGYSDCHE